MTEQTFQRILIVIALTFTAAFCYLVIPPLSENFDVLGAFAAGFVNPYSSGYSLDVLLCWLILAVWVRFEAVTLGIKRGWVCLVVGVVPGVAVGFALYLVLRQRQLPAEVASP